MKSNAIPLVTILSFFCLTSCKNSSSDKRFDKLEKMNWLLGNWEQKLPNGTLVENWKKENDSTYSGESYFINPKDTIHFELIKLHQNEDELLYTATVNGQNDDKPIDFTLTSELGNTFTFENPTHDYPQKIVYKKIAPDRLIAVISGLQAGKQSQESYPMKKK